MFYDFWKLYRRNLAEDEWKRRFERATANWRFALGRRDTEMVLNVVLHRSYAVRNQIVRGGVTCNSPRI